MSDPIPPTPDEVAIEKYLDIVSTLVDKKIVRGQGMLILQAAAAAMVQIAMEREFVIAGCGKFLKVNDRVVFRENPNQTALDRLDLKSEEFRANIVAARATRLAAAVAAKSAPDPTPTPAP